MVLLCKARASLDFPEMHDAMTFVVRAGQQQLLCLARVLLARPRIVCLDECTASVDPRTARHMQELVAKQLQGATVIQVCVLPRTCDGGHAPV